MQKTHGVYDNNGICNGKRSRILKMFTTNNQNKTKNHMVQLSVDLYTIRPVATAIFQEGHARTWNADDGSPAVQGLGVAALTCHLAAKMQ